jgi:flagellar basal-body rod protein FlgG
MDASLWIAKTGLDAQQTRMSVISNNLANVNTVGFKRDRAAFQDMLYQTVKQAGGPTAENAQSPTGMMLGTGVRVMATEKTHTQGNLTTTQNALDVAITGDGFFQIAQPGGTLAYTRDGSFKVSASGQLVTANGAALQPEIIVPPGAASLTIGGDGTVSAEMGGAAGSRVLGVIQVARFVSPAGLQPIGQNLLKETPASGAAQPSRPGTGSTGSLLQGSLEASNVNVVEEMVNMIETQRAYEINSKAISAADGMLKFVNNNL